MTKEDMKQISDLMDEKFVAFEGRMDEKFIASEDRMRAEIAASEARTGEKIESCEEKITVTACDEKITSCEEKITACDEKIASCEEKITACDGSLSTGHAHSPEGMLSRLETMVLTGSAELPLEAIRQQIASAVDYIVHLSRLRDFSRKCMEITEVTGYKDGRVTLNSIYKFK